VSVSGKKPVMSVWVTRLDHELFARHPSSRQHHRSESARRIRRLASAKPLPLRHRDRSVRQHCVCRYGTILPHASTPIGREFDESTVTPDPVLRDLIGRLHRPLISPRASLGPNQNQDGHAQQQAFQHVVISMRKMLREQSTSLGLGHRRDFRFCGNFGRLGRYLF
jgi:hypothetical protein